MSTPHIRQSPSQLQLVADPATLTVRAVISTNDPDRAGDVVLPRGLRNADEFLRNPVVLWAHQRSLPPIGTCQKLEVLDNQILAETQFAKGVPFAEEVFRLYEQGILRAWSIGFLPVRSRPGGQGTLVEEWDLLEYSAVPVPENPAALTLALRKGLVQDETLKRWFEPLAVDVFAELLIR
jgi:hypothetical protein